jgi:hypothetical protein
MSIRPTIIDRNGNNPCIPQVALLAAMRCAAEGRAPSLADRFRQKLTQLRKRLGL